MRLPGSSDGGGGRWRGSRFRSASIGLRIPCSAQARSSDDVPPDRLLGPSEAATCNTRVRLEPKLPGQLRPTTHWRSAAQCHNLFGVSYVL
jgi:hypothetical protein